MDDNHALVLRTDQPFDHGSVDALVAEAVAGDDEPIGLAQTRSEAGVLVAMDACGVVVELVEGADEEERPPVVQREVKEVAVGIAEVVDVGLRRAHLGLVPPVALVEREPNPIERPVQLEQAWHVRRIGVGPDHHLAELPCESIAVGDSGTAQALLEQCVVVERDDVHGRDHGVGARLDHHLQA